MKVRVQKNWRNRPHPWWFARRYPSGRWAVHVGPIEVWGVSRERREPMKVVVMQRTSTSGYGRSRLTVHRWGFAARFERRQVGGGWYTRSRIDFPWPWVRR